MAKSYTAKDIQVLEGLEPVRKRPAMYIGGVDLKALHHLLAEVLDNSIDEVINGYASKVVVSLDKDGCGMTVIDNGRGIPVDIHPKHKKSALEIIMCTLHAGGKFDGENYKHSGGLHGVGISVVNALSRKLTATVQRDGWQYEMSFSRGKPTTGLAKAKASGPSGTRIHFEPDPEIFPRVRFDPILIKESLEAKSYLHKGLKIAFEDKTSGETHRFHSAEGIPAYLEKIVKDRGKNPTHEQIYHLDNGEDPRFEVALQWTDETQEYIRSYVNGVITPGGGTHEAGLKNAVMRALRNYITTHKLLPKGVNLTGEDIREGLTGLISLYHHEPQFQGQTKDRLNNTEVTAQVAGLLGPHFESFLNENRTIGDAIVYRIVLAARARAASRAAAGEVKSKAKPAGRLKLPAKLADCSERNPEKTEVFIVEGDSAGGSAKQGRDRKTQAILPLKGKILNTEEATLAKLLGNQEINDLIQALGCGIGKSYSPRDLRYHKIIILTDADSDGHHIATLLMTFFYRHLPDLIRRGHLYLGQPPLYKIRAGKEIHWVKDDVEKEEVLARIGGRAKPEITRFKGLGEMSAKELAQTSLEPKSRVLWKVVVDNELQTDETLREMMGKDPSARFRLVMERSEEAEEVDV
ncbi:MAG: type IIA DNA topoisomerase subunit B [Planctomycetes bacterium]|nr:type IIA DNA topoisomerase subunit B [Planctomycetota bacterium]